MPAQPSCYSTEVGTERVTPGKAAKLGSRKKKKHKMKCISDKGVLEGKKQSVAHPRGRSRCPGPSGCCCPPPASTVILYRLLPRAPPLVLGCKLPLYHLI